jgi:hypothetical protein
MPDRRYFPLTGHTLQFGFKAFWERNGGIALFGMPISEEFQEQGPDGFTHTVQYFERARFEYHPEFKGTPYEVELGLLAREISASQLGGGAFAPVGAGTTPVGGRFYAETGHALADPFLTFWDTHGGLAVFGFPISEAFEERNPDTGQVYLIQYFERYRMEWHPDENTVELGRLGVQAAQQYGYLPR